MIAHRVLYFTLDGTGHSAGTLCYPFGGAVLPPAARAHSNAGAVVHGRHNVYVVPAEDHLEHWYRMMGETRVKPDNDPHKEDRALAHHTKAKHTGGVQHPEHAHVRLGGTVTWDSDPHPLVQEHMDMLKGMSTEELILHLMGPDAFKQGTVR